MIFERAFINKLRSAVYKRNDDTGALFYFDASDFPGLKKEAFSFESNRNEKLQGYFYSYAYARDDVLVIFDHGMGGGHRSYMKEIELLCKNRFEVFAYDHTGCMESQGKDINGFAQSLSDLDSAVKALSASSRAGRRLFVMGHSWGGYAALNVPALHPEIERVAALSGFRSVSAIVDQFTPGLMRFYRKALKEHERASNPRFFDFDALETIKNSRSRFLLIHSSDDKTVDPKIHFRPLQKELSGKKNVDFRLVSGKGHNPNYSDSAVSELKRLFSELKAKSHDLDTPEKRKAFRDSFDWDAMTGQDPVVWDWIITFFNKE